MKRICNYYQPESTNKKDNKKNRSVAIDVTTLPDCNGEVAGRERTVE